MRAVSVPFVTSSRGLVPPPFREGFHDGGRGAVTLSAVHPELVGLTMTYSKSELFEDFVLGTVLAILGFRYSERFRRQRGVTPWKLPSAAWAVLLFFLPPVALVYLVACLTTRPKPGPTGWNAPPQGWPPSQGHPGQVPQGWSPPPGSYSPGPHQGWDAPPPAGWVAPPPPGGWDAPPPPGTVFPGPPGTGMAPPAPVPAAPPSPRAWLADPAGRHELRYWDGTTFTEHVYDAGKISVDPL